ncbi:MAG TPA: phage tail protein [Alphaproteobacteria bacterium]|nr:phage tail protein [Alphaproteobacteria bacterium]
MARRDPFRSFRFWIEIDNLAQGGFSRVRGASVEIKYESYHEGGLNEHEHKFATRAVHSPIVLERGLVEDSMWVWHREIVEGRIKRKTLAIVLKDDRGQDARRWLVDSAFPVKWSISDLDASGAQILVESIEFAHHGLRAG